MSLTPEDPAGRQAIEAYGDGGFRVSGHRYDGSLLVLPDEIGQMLSLPPEDENRQRKQNQRVLFRAQVIDRNNQRRGNRRA